MDVMGETDPLATQPGAPVNNLLTYAFGVDLAGGDLIASMPAVGVTEVGMQNFLTFEYRRRMIDPVVGYLIQSSIDGVSWLPAGTDLVEIDVDPEGDGTERVSLRAVDPLVPGNEVLLRVQVTAL